MTRIVLGMAAFGLVVCSVWGQPRSWNDDFKTDATYDDVSLFWPCPSYGGGPSTKYTVLEAFTGDIYNDHAVSGGGGLRLTSRAKLNSLNMGRFIVSAIGVLDVGQPCPDNPGSGGTLVTSEPFTSSDVCMYGGVLFTPWHLMAARNEMNQIFGQDLQPGVANVDDDLDGNTDDEDEALPSRPTTVNNGYGNKNGTGYKAGLDAAPGVAGVDDDGNGVVDDYGEIGWRDSSGNPLSDDGDDTQYLMFYGMLKGNFSTTSFVYLNIDVGTGGGNICSLRSVVETDDQYIIRGDELVPGFYKANTPYNWMMCHSGTCWGAMLWTGTDMANPDETLGPGTSSHHTAPDDNLAGFITHAGGAFDTVKIYNRQHEFRGNQNFDEEYWVISGASSTHYPSPSADLDDDLDVDGFDFLTFSNCYNGSNKPPLVACGNDQADLDKDGDVDGFDFLTFSNCYNGSNRRPLAACFPPNLTTCP